MDWTSTSASYAPPILASAWPANDFQGQAADYSQMDGMQLYGDLSFDGPRRPRKRRAKAQSPPSQQAHPNFALDGMMDVFSSPSSATTSSNDSSVRWSASPPSGSNLALYQPFNAPLDLSYEPNSSLRADRPFTLHPGYADEQLPDSLRAHYTC